jgi:multidrug efflux pump subunit AcrA (membrane-fusion protein)
MRSLPAMLINTLLGTLAGGCERAAAPASTLPPFPVVLLSVTAEEVPLAVEEVGRVEASNSVTVLPRIGGQILTRHFVEGQAVAASDPLYSVDPASFEARPRSAEAELAKTRVQLSDAQDEADR